MVTLTESVVQCRGDREVQGTLWCSYRYSIIFQGAIYRVITGEGIPGTTPTIHPLVPGICNTRMKGWSGQGVLQCDGYLVGRDGYTGDIVLWS